VLVATDFSPGAARAVERAAQLPLAARARVVVVAVLPLRGQDADAAAVKEQLRRTGELFRRRVRPSTPEARVDTVLLRGMPHEQIAAAATTAGADVIVLGRHGHRPLADLFGLGTTADRLVRVADTPLIVVGRRPHGPYRRPLVALDHPAAPTTRRAIRAARGLVGPSARWTALHVADDLYAAAMRRARLPQHRIAEQYRAEGTRLRRAIGSELSHRFAGLGWIVCVEWGEPRFAVPSAAAKRAADLIVLGARTRRTLDRRILGTVAEAALRRARCDVLIAPGWSARG
jgi:nucleotide-binding universal stress UspA family protein